MRSNKLCLESIFRLTLAAPLLVMATFVTATPAFAQKYAVLHNFGGASKDGAFSYGGVVFDAAGNLYGTTVDGGAYNHGAVYELSPKAGGGWSERTLYSFGNGPADGQTPFDSLVLDAAGNLYGTTGYGGAGGEGTVFQLTPNRYGEWNENILYFFSGPDGNNPTGGVVLDADGNLYSTTFAGGDNDDGIVFELKRPRGWTGTGPWAEEILHSFNGSDGSGSYAALTFDAAGNLYGTTADGGLYNSGTVFVMKRTARGTWQDTVLYNFGSSGQDGIVPFAGVVLGAAGHVYGTTYAGGAYGHGTVFELTPTTVGEWTETILHNFDFNGSDGTEPYAGIVFDQYGNIYGTTLSGGYYLEGTLYELAPATGGQWKETLLHHFNANGTDGFMPYATPILDFAGNLYGTTSFGGEFGGGIAFEITH